MLKFKGRQEQEKQESTKQLKKKSERNRVGGRQNETQWNNKIALLECKAATPDSLSDRIVTSLSTGSALVLKNWVGLD